MNQTIRVPIGSLLLLTAVAIPLPALAQTLAPAANDWTPLFNNALTAILGASVTAIAGIIVAAGSRFASKLGYQATAQDKANLENDLTSAANVGITKVLPLIEAKGWSDPSVRDAILSEATDYLRRRFPDRAAQITAAAQPASAPGVSPVSSSTAISETIAARLPDAITKAAASPGTPEVAATPAP